MTRSINLAETNRVPGARQATPAGQWMAFGAIAGPILFHISWFVLGFVSPGYTLWGHHFAHYSPLSQPISGLGIGATAPLMNTAFAIGGLLLLLGMVGIFQTTKGQGRPGLRRASLALLALSGLGQMICGVFTLEAMMLHNLGVFLGVCLPVFSFLIAGSYFRGIPQWRRFGNWLRLGSPLTLLLVVLFFTSFSPTADGAEHGIAGLTERILIIEVLAWFMVMGWLALSRRTGRAGTPAVGHQTINPNGTPI